MGRERGKKKKKIWIATGSGPRHHVELSQLAGGLWGQQTRESGYVLTPPGPQMPVQWPPGLKLVFARLLNNAEE